MSEENPTSLLEFLRACTPLQRVRLAELAQTSISYLYQLATRKRPNPSGAMLFRLEFACIAVSTPGMLVVTARGLVAELQEAVR